MKKWQCSVCQYIHEGEEPPDKCPICGADKDKFVRISQQDLQDEGTKQNADSTSTVLEKITALMLAKHLHPISVHGPNGIIPMAVLFLAIAVLFQSPNFGNAAYLSMLFVLLSMPMVLLSGYLTWKKKYKGALTRLFKIKIAASCVATSILFLLVLWKALRPDILSDGSLDRFIFLFWALFLLAAVGIAGHLGGQLVFGKDNQ